MRVGVFAASGAAALSGPALLLGVPQRLALAACAGAKIWLYIAGNACTTHTTRQREADQSESAVGTQ